MTYYAAPLIDFSAIFLSRMSECIVVDGMATTDSISVFTDKSEMEIRTGVGVYSERLNLICSFRLPN